MYPQRVLIVCWNLHLKTTFLGAIFPVEALHNLPKSGSADLRACLGRSLKPSGLQSRELQGAVLRVDRCKHIVYRFHLVVVEASAHKLSASCQLRREAKSVLSLDPDLQRSLQLQTLIKDENVETCGCEGCPRDAAKLTCGKSRQHS